MVALVAAGHLEVVWSVRRVIEPFAKHAWFQIDLNSLTMCLLMHKHLIAFEGHASDHMGVQILG